MEHPPANPAADIARAATRAPLRPEAVHPALWLGHQLGRQAESAVPSGFAALDAQLPGRGWPRRALTELLLPHPGIGEIRLLAASLVAIQRAGRLVMLFDPPAALSAHAFARLGLEVEQLLLIDTRSAQAHPTAGRSGGDGLWALEQALKSGHVGAVLAWLPPRVRSEALRRLQLAAQAHDGPAFVLRELAVARQPSAAPLRLALQVDGADRLALRVLKRRGPPLAAPLRLELPPVLDEEAQARADEWQLQQQAQAQAQGQGQGQGLVGPAGLHAATFINLAA